jgi:uroporphyrinogen-III synthase
LQQKSLVVPHLRIEESARELGFRSVRLTGSGDGALLAALQSRP